MCAHAPVPASICACVKRFLSQPGDKLLALLSTTSPLPMCASVYLILFVP